MGVVRLHLFLFLLFHVVHSKKSSPTITCGNNSFFIQYPFQSLEQGHKPHIINGYSEFNIRCTSDGIAVLNLSSSSGEFYIRDINYFEQKIELEDPGKCLPTRFMKLNFSSDDSPFRAVLYQKYTFLRCPRRKVEGPNFTAIGCLSNSRMTTFATSLKSRAQDMKSNGCRPMVSDLPIPVTWIDQYELNGFDGNLVLEWDVSVCHRCTGRSRRKSVGKIILISIFILSIAALITMLFVGSCFLCFIGLKSETHNEANESPHDSFTIRLETVQMPAAATMDSLSTVQACQPEELVVDESQRISGPNGEACPICMEEYQPTDRLQRLDGCYHCFHAPCLSRWLLRDSSCPICRAFVIP